MADLLSSGPIANIKLALKDVTDTFFKTSITYQRHKEVLDRFNEDRDKVDVPETFTLLAGIEYGKGAGEINETESGAEDNSTVMLMIAFGDLPAQMRDGNLAVVNPTTDYFLLNGIKYRVNTPAIYDGFFDATPVLINIGGERYEAKT